MTWLDFGGQRSRSQQAIEVAKEFMLTLVHQVHLVCNTCIVKP